MGFTTTFLLIGVAAVLFGVIYVAIIQPVLRKNRSRIKHGLDRIESREDCPNPRVAEFNLFHLPDFPLISAELPDRIFKRLLENTQSRDIRWGVVCRLGSCWFTHGLAMTEVGGVKVVFLPAMETPVLYFQNNLSVIAIQHDDLNDLIGAINQSLPESLQWNGQRPTMEEIVRQDKDLWTRVFADMFMNYSRP